MWNRRKEEEVKARPSSPNPSSPGATEGMPMQTTSSRFENDPPPPSRAATIGKGVSITGQIFSREDLIIDGEIDGTIEANEHRITIGPNGKVKAAIKAKDIVVLGAVQGNVQASEKVDIKKDARLVGDIKTARISIEDGAIFKGSIDIVRVDAPKATSKPQPVATPPATQQSMATTAGNGESKR
jgi:cytoskeletal protein CcmA (bactofilin family)